MARWVRGTGLMVVVAVALSIGGMTEVGAQESRPITVMVGDRTVEGMTVSACLDGVERPAGATAVGADTTIQVRGRTLRTVTDAVAWRSVAPAPGCPGGVWAVVRLAVSEFAPEDPTDVPINLWGEAQVVLRVTLTAGPDAGETHVGFRQFRVVDGPPRGGIMTVRPTPEGLRVIGYVVDPTGAGPARYRITVSGRNVVGSEWHPSTWSELPDRRADEPAPSGVEPSPPVHNVDGLRGDYWIDELVPFGEACLFGQDPRATSDELDASSLAYGCMGGGLNSLNGLRSARLGAVDVSSSGPPLRQNLTVRGTVMDPWVSPGEPGPTLLVRVEGSGEQVTVRARPRPDLSGPLPDLSGAFDFVATVPGVSQGTKRICIYDHATTHPREWSAWMWPRETPLDCRDGMPVPSSAPSPAIGYLESAVVDGRRVTLTGWALDREGGVPRVLLSANGRLVALTTPSRSRPDVQREHGGDGRAGFAATIELGPGSHLICPAFGDTTHADQWSHGPCASVVVK